MKIILPASEIPVGATVTKITGAVEYKVRDTLEIYGPQRQTIEALYGSRFLIGANGNANAVSATTELVWHADPIELMSYLCPEEDK